MHLILCVDDRNGLSFCGRRLSRDSALCTHILQLTEGHALWMDAYSAKLFPAGEIKVHAQCQSMAAKGEYCFVETAPLLDRYEDLESVILYHWNRTYPATVYLPHDFLRGFTLSQTLEFSGTSHEGITMERYTL